MGEQLETKELKEFATQLGFQTLGVCQAVAPPHIDAYSHWIAKGYHGQMDYLARHIALKEDPSSLLPGAQSVIVCSLNYFQPTQQIDGQPRIARYAIGRDYHKVLRKKLKKLSAYIENAHPNAQCRPCVDSAPIMERDFAQQAGLGFFGKNTMIIDPRRGSWFFLGLLITTVAFEPDQPFEGGCGSCTKCIDACPTGAIVFEDDRWQLDARKCISYLTIEHKGEIEPDIARHMGDWTFGCDVCQEVCPFNEPREAQPLRAQPTSEHDFLNAREWPSTERVANLKMEEWDRLTSGSAIRRAGLDGIRRNAEINLRNRPTSKSDSK